MSATRPSNHTSKSQNFHLPSHSRKPQEKRGISVEKASFFHAHENHKHRQHLSTGRQLVLLGADCLHGPHMSSASSPLPSRIVPGPLFTLPGWLGWPAGAGADAEPGWHRRRLDSRRAAPSSLAPTCCSAPRRSPPEEGNAKKNKKIRKRPKRKTSEPNKLEISVGGARAW